MPKFEPKKPFTLHTPGSHFGNKDKDSQFLSGIIEEHIERGGVLTHVYRFLGTFEQERDALGVNRDTHEATYEPTDINTFMGIQDTVLNENRDRCYDFDVVPSLPGVYTVSQNELEYARFGMALANDIITMEFHAEAMERQLGRRLILGDVIELDHLREVTISGRIANRWYEVAQVVWSPTGYDPMYARHVFAVVLKPLRHQQEFLEFFEQEDEYGKTLAEQASNRDALMAVTETNQELAREHANTTWYDTTIMWFDPDHPDRKPYRWNDDGKPDNGLPVDQGTEFPPIPNEGDWFLRTDLEPNKLYRFQDDCWRLREEDIKREWQPYNWVVKLREFMSDRSEADQERGWELRSIHDVITVREPRSDPSPEEE